MDNGEAGWEPVSAGGRQLGLFCDVTRTMGILSDFIIGDDASARAYDGIGEFPADDRCQFKRITPLEAAGILTALRGGGDPIEMIDAFPLISDADAEAWTMRVPADMVALLAALDDEQIAPAAKACADATAEELGWLQNDFEEVLLCLRQLARRAEARSKQMYLWNSL